MPEIPYTCIIHLFKHINEFHVFQILAPPLSSLYSGGDKSLRPVIGTGINPYALLSALGSGHCRPARHKAAFN